MSPTREYAIVDPDSGYFRTVAAPGPVSVIESDAGQLAPVCSLIVTDADDGARGEIVAERGADGWHLRGVPWPTCAPADASTSTWIRTPRPGGIP